MSCVLWSHYSTELSEPVPWNFVSFEHLFSKFLIATVLDCVYFKSVGIGVDVMILCEKVTNGVESCHNTNNHETHYLGIRNLASWQEHKIFWDVMCHLRCTWWYSIVVFNHPIVQLWRHSNNHVIKIGIEESTFWNIMTERWVVMEPSQNVIGVVDETWRVWVHFGKIRRPYSLVSAFGLMYSEIRGPHSIMDNSLPEVPFLEEISLVFLVSWMELW